jgi:hypothetical protein
MSITARLLFFFFFFFSFFWARGRCKRSSLWTIGENIPTACLVSLFWFLAGARMAAGKHSAYEDRYMNNSNYRVFVVVILLVAGGTLT